MTDEAQTIDPTETVPPEPEDIKTVLETLRAMQEKQDTVPVEPTPQAPPQAAPAAPAPPDPPTGRVTREQYEELARYAAEQRQRAEQLQLAQEFGLDAGALEGNFESPADMRRHAEVLALRQQMASLEAKLAAAQTPADEPPLVPAADTGGPTSNEDSRVTELRHQYDEARALGRTETARKALLQAIYADPTKRVSIR